ncbi:MAG: YggS family pyridoxal phosphate-dependent enzyme [Chitinophagaceae bacterium]|nr:YggS family pyridoxal phosphate-dependent enzyme [Chitinophagaceae bacterium]
MAVNIERYKEVVAELLKQNITLVAVSKTKPNQDISDLYNSGQRDFGENYVQELVDKHAVLPSDIRWHFIGHLQTNKAKYIAPFVHLIHGVDSFKLLKEINKQAARCGRVIDCLLQVHIAQEETKFGMDEAELKEVQTNMSSLPNVQISGLMGMASLSDDPEMVRSEFRNLKSIYDRYCKWTTDREQWTILSMGMSSDYRIAIEEGSTMVRIGSLLFGSRQ